MACAASIWKFDALPSIRPSVHVSKLEELEGLKYEREKNRAKKNKTKASCPSRWKCMLYPRQPSDSCCNRRCRRRILAKSANVTINTTRAKLLDEPWIQFVVLGSNNDGAIGGNPRCGWCCFFYHGSSLLCGGCSVIAQARVSQRLPPHCRLGRLRRRSLRSAVFLVVWKLGVLDFILLTRS
ncbi:hypothetical protein BC567DRAFT_217295 [Phyllosticta citribraziliensis]